MAVFGGAYPAGGRLFAPKPEPVKTGTIADGDYDPANWGKLYPLEYDS